MSEKSARWRYSWLFALKVGGSAGVLFAIITDFFFALAPIGMWLFLIALTILMVTGMIAVLQPTESEVHERSLWFAPFALSLLVFFVLMLSAYITSESAVGGMGYLANTVPGVDSLQAAIGLSSRR